MSHFTVLVIGEDPNTALAPFQENNLNDCPEEFLEFVEVDYKEGFNTEDISVYINSDDSEIIISYNEYSKLNEYDRLQYYEDKIPLVDFYNDYNQYMLDCGYTFNDKIQKFGYYENPNAKWDWWKLGGRWCGFFKLKEGCKGALGSSSLVTDDFFKGNYADSALKGDIDFDFMINTARDKANIEFDIIEQLLCNNDLNFNNITTYSFTELINEPSKVYTLNKNLSSKYSTPSSIKTILEEGVCSSNFISAIRYFYNLQTIVKIINTEDRLRCFDCCIDKYCLNKENPRESYINKSVKTAYTTFAVVYKGEWFERGTMDWWGCVSDEKDLDTWAKEFNELVLSLQDDTLLSLIDCHI